MYARARILKSWCVCVCDVNGLGLGFPQFSISQSKMDQRHLNFRKYLFRLGEKLSSQELDNLIFMCGVEVNAARLERVRTATELFQALSERGKLSADNLDYLTQILASINRENLLHDMIAAGYRSSSSPAKSKEYMFQECLVKIAQDLTSADVERLAFIFMDSLVQLNPKNIFSATQLFQIMKQRQVITCSDLRPLHDALLEIGRNDAACHIATYLHEAKLGSYHQYTENQVGNGNYYKLVLDIILFCV